MAVLCERTGPAHRAVAGSIGLPIPTPVEHAELFIHQLPPYASIYLGFEGKIGGEARDRIAGFWRALGVGPPPEPDHLASLLGLWAALSEAVAGEPQPERRSLLEHSLRALVWEHLASWLIPYLARIGDIGNDPYASWGRLLGRLVAEAIPDDHDSAMPVHLNTDPDIPEIPGGLAPFLLAPIRSGLVITRADLQRAAAELRLGLRVGERAFVLRHLLEQDREAVFGWVAAEAERQEALFGSSPINGWLAELWSSRAAETASIIRGPYGPAP